MKNCDAVIDGTLTPDQIAQAIFETVSVMRR